MNDSCLPATRRPPRTFARAPSVALRALCAGLLLHSAARAQGAPNEWRTPSYYRGNVAATSLLLGSSAVLNLLAPLSDRACDFDGFPGDEGRRGRSSQQADRISDRLVIAAIAEPGLLGAAHGQGPRFVNSTLVFGETLAVNLALNGMTKLLFPRSRPYTYAHDHGGYDDPRDYRISFYSSHSSNSFAAAMSGSYLFAESTRSAWAKRGAWAASFALAGATATLRVRAGRHYYSDIVTGALLGSTIGIVVPVLHGERYRPDVGECVSAGTGLVLGVLTSELLPLSERGDDASLWLAPYSVGAALGLQGSGKF